MGCEKTECRQLRGGREKAGERLRSKGSFFFFFFCTGKSLNAVGLELVGGKKLRRQGMEGETHSTAFSGRQESTA